MLGLVEVLLVAGAVTSVATWMGVVALLPLWRRWSKEELAFGWRAMRARMWLYAPLWVPMTLIVAALSPKVWGRLLGQGDHCLDHGVHHHLCVFHPPHVANEPLAWGLVVGVVLFTFVAVWMRGRRFVGELLLSRALIRSGRPSELGDEVRVLEREEPIALTVGWWRPVILLSRGLIESVGARELRVILAHERAHIGRRDTLWAVGDGLLGTLYPAGVREYLLGELDLAREQACDAVAAREEGRVPVAAALTAVSRLKLKSAGVGISVMASSLEARVRYLLDPPLASRWWSLAVVMVVSVVFVAGAGPFHGLVERVIAILLH